MYPGMVNSPETVLTAAVDELATVLHLADATKLPAAPNICTLGLGADAETVSYALDAVDGVLTVTRGVQGTARPWAVGTKVARRIAEMDIAALQANVADHESRIGGGSLDDLSDVTITTPTTGQVIAYNGTVFANADPTGGGAEVWTEVTDVTASPPSTSTLTLTADLTATIKPGMPIKFIVDGDPYYAICTAITSTLLTIAGAPIEGAIDALYYGDPARVIIFPVLIPGYYEDATDTTLMANDLGWAYYWPNVAAYLVRVSAKTRVADSSSNGVVNARINSTDVLSTGLTLANTNVTTSVVQIAAAAYDVQFGELIEVSATKGTGGDAQDLSMILTFVIP